MNANDLATRLAAIKAARVVLDRQEAAAKAALLAELGPGDRKHALVDGADCATVSVSASQPGLVVDDSRAFLAWCKAHAPESVEERVRETGRKAIFTAALRSGELPDGVSLGPDRDPVVSVRMTADQQDALMAAFRNGRIALADVLALGARNEPDK